MGPVTGPRNLVHFSRESISGSALESYRAGGWIAGLLSGVEFKAQGGWAGDSADGFQLACR